MSEHGPEETPGASGRRKAPTIDLTATEIEGAVGGDPVGGSSQEPGSSDVHLSSESGEASSQNSKNGILIRMRRIPWLPIGAGAVGGGIITAAVLLANLFLNPDAQDSNLAARLARVEQQLRNPSESPGPAVADTKIVNDLAARVGKLEAAIATLREAGSDPQSANRISNLEGEVKALAESVGIAARRGDEAATAARDARQRADAASAALVQLEQKIKTAVADPAALQALTDRVASLERAEKTIEAELAKRADADGHDPASRFAIAAAALNAALDRGKPFTAELAAVKTAVKTFVTDAKLLAAVEPFAGSGIPTASALAQELSELMPSLRRASGVPPRDGGFLEKLQANAEKLVRIRALNEAVSDDPSAIVSRIEIDASKVDLSAALADLAKLAPAVRAPADAWIEKVQRRSAALEAGRLLVTQSLSGLSR
jgi:hypothetical protein